MTSEARLEHVDGGLVPTDEGWFVLNAREARWRHADGRGARLTFEGEREFPQVGVGIFVLAPGESMGMYHWEADQEDFLVLSRRRLGRLPRGPGRGAARRQCRAGDERGGRGLRWASEATADRFPRGLASVSR